MSDLSKLCVHTITTKPWTLQVSIDKFQAKGIGGISVWQNAVEPYGVEQAGKLLASSDLEVVSYVRGGFFTASTEVDRLKAVDHNKQMIKEAAQIGAPLLVLVCGADPSLSKEQDVEHIRNGIEAVLPFAIEHDVKLGIEPLHPVYADTRSAINTLAQATGMAASFDSPFVTTVFDVYHLWWDPDLFQDIQSAFDQDLFGAYHICDWLVPTQDVLNDRGIMGQGCIELKKIDGKINELGFDGFKEVEIFSDKHWQHDQDQYLEQIISAYEHIYQAT